MAKMIHSMLRVFNEERSVAFYENAFGLNVSSRLDFETFVLLYLSNDETGFELELTINKNRKEPYEVGDGYGHLAFCVDNLDSEHQRFEQQGFKPRKIVDFQHEGKALARFFFVADPDGYEIEVLEKSERYC